MSTVIQAEELQERTDKLCTAVWTKDVGTITLLADQRKRMLGKQMKASGVLTYST